MGARDPGWRLVRLGGRRALALGGAAVAVALGGACGGGEAGTSPGPATCAGGEKTCDGRCVDVDDPAFGCAADGCAPCPSAGVPMACGAGVCVVGECPAGTADCDGEAGNGCEIDTRSEDLHCGACGAECAGLTRCSGGTCSPISVADWLASQRHGWCQDEPNELMNLCGDVPFCFDTDVMRPYPDGLEIHAGFHYDGVSDGILFDLGGDCDLKRASCVFETAGTLSCSGPAGPRVSSPVLGAGPHLVTLRASEAGTWLFVDGVEVASGGGSSVAPELIGECGPGLVLGQRISYWWEDTSAGWWLRHAPFLLHLRSRARSDAWSLSAAIEPDPDSVLLFDSSGVDGVSWTDRVHGKVGVRCGGRSSPEASGYAVPCEGPGWVLDAAQACL
ncbi:MAG: hypothetical protein IT376_21600 [Polyangiaceae bacterium]|nr:hypothetical protein [Polyangiaceae bacterium]